jgi:hypothetical protein
MCCSGARVCASRAFRPIYIEMRRRTRLCKVTLPRQGLGHVGCSCTNAATANLPNRLDSCEAAFLHIIYIPPVRCSFALSFGAADSRVNLMSEGRSRFLTSRHHHRLSIHAVLKPAAFQNSIESVQVVCFADVGRGRGIALCICTHSGVKRIRTCRHWLQHWLNNRCQLLLNSQAELTPTQDNSFKLWHDIYEKAMRVGGNSAISQIRFSVVAWANGQNDQNDLKGLQVLP